MLDGIRQLGTVEGRTDGVVEVEPARDDVESVEPAKRPCQRARRQRTVLRLVQEPHGLRLSHLSLRCLHWEDGVDRALQQTESTYFCADDGDVRANMAGGKRMSCATGAM